MRVSIFTASAIGYVDNPEALYARGLAWGLAERGHTVRMLEERRNPALLRTLELAGPAASRHVFERFPAVLIHSFEPRRGGRLMEWVARELSLCDLALAVHGLPVELARWIANLDHANLTRAFVTYRPESLSVVEATELELERFDLLFAAGPPPSSLSWEPLWRGLAPQDAALALAANATDAAGLHPVEVAGKLEEAVQRVAEEKLARLVSRRPRPNGSG
jgi:hypothetical protein